MVTNGVKNIKTYEPMRLLNMQFDGLVFSFVLGGGEKVRCGEFLVLSLWRG
jgi:hypothetical protein